MPAFKELFPLQHKKLYKSFKELDNYLNKCKDGEELNLEKVKELKIGPMSKCLDGCNQWKPKTAK